MITASSETEKKGGEGGTLKQEMLEVQSQGSLRSKQKHWGERDGPFSAS